MRSSQGATDEPVDVIVLGGGITGAGVARDAALRGLSVALFERSDFGAGTSSKSSKLVHGGLRYLENYEFGLVFESVSERRMQTLVAPHLVTPLPFLLPVYKDTKPGIEIMNLGLWIYDALALFRSPGLHRTVRGKKAAKALEPCLRTDALRGVIQYYDCATDDSRLTLENILDAESLGAVCRNYVKVTGLQREGARVTGVHVTDQLTGATRTIAGRVVIVAAGAWTDEAASALGIPFGRTVLRRTKGVHIVVPRECIPITRAVTLKSPLDGRVMFAIPWRERTVLGTTDTDYEGPADLAHADAADVAYLCDSANRYFSGVNVTSDHVIATWSGLRPLIRPDESVDESDVSREHEVFVLPEGIVAVAGGKLTTYRLMAAEVVDHALTWLRANDPSFATRAIGNSETADRPLPGAADLVSPDMDGLAMVAHELMRRFALAPDVAAHLCGVYGGRALALGELIATEPTLGERINSDLPYVWAEIDYAATVERARTLTDVLARRVPLLLVGRDQGLDVCQLIAARLASLLHWSPRETTQQVDAYLAEVAASRQFRVSATRPSAA